VSEENVKVVREAFAAFTEGDLEAATRLVNPEFEFHGTVGGLQEGDVSRGLAEFLEVFEEQDLDAWKERRFEAEEFLDAGDQVVALVREYRRGRGSGVVVEVDTAVLYGVSEGQVVRVQGYMDRDAARAAAGLPS
jgi:ketosteroid isomerase-like protein